MEPSSAGRCTGSSNFFWLPKGGGCKFLSRKVNGERLSSKDAMFADSLLICLECRSFLKTNKQMRGHVAMLYDGNFWEMIFVVRESPDEILSYPFDLEKF